MSSATVSLETDRKTLILHLKNGLVERENVELVTGGAIWQRDFEPVQLKSIFLTRFELSGLVCVSKCMADGAAAPAMKNAQVVSKRFRRKEILCNFFSCFMCLLVSLVFVLVSGDLEPT